MLRTAVEDLTGRLPSTELSRAKQTCREIAECLNELRDVPRAAELAKNLIADLVTANRNKGIQIRCNARKMLIEALAVQYELDAALAELDRFIADAQPPSMYVQEFEYLIHNVGLNCALLSWIRSPIAAELLSRLLSGGRAELVQQCFPKEAAARVWLLRGVDALHSDDLGLAEECVDKFRLQGGNSLPTDEPRRAEWHIANVLDDALAIEKDRAGGFTRPAPRPHKYSGIARYMLLPRHLQLLLAQCTPDLLPLLKALAVLTTAFSRPLGGRSVPACHCRPVALVRVGQVLLHGIRRALRLLPGNGSGLCVYRVRRSIRIGYAVRSFG